ncbi:purine-cytosine permease family protein [Rhodococcus qingshengii]|jgi:NCS1 family nucleobase:cation symporter-1|uniref:Cytosine permease n=2 Tax=Rhodococcus erythropolis group TaxID=2840174 RepID=A0A1F2Q4E4_RHOER|nr:MULTISPECIES: cytosine permease [Rhodococcus]AGT95440.1 permease, cytosine/purine, uracil, thiamine, allantoin family protein [Rhodococcus erythropolis CCM2595]MBH5146905.1 cytosine permease [Rhodococcus erythropolis]MBO8149294.1 cytosine permease [Rhodococcus erythropolis]MCZ4547681.1 cytosine permease [Rhodococcus qingshengii]MDE8646730.1 cytosine permease [Rhodococcus qingshengii]
MKTTDSSLIEDLTIQPVPEERRTGTARHLFSVWFGVQIMPLTLVMGVLGPTVYGLDIASTIAAIVLGNLIGAVFMALHSVQGSKLGVPQMIQARGQFGMYGSLLVLVVVILMYLGFLASIIVLARDTLVALVPALNPSLALVLTTGLTLVAVIFGYEFIHRLNRALLVLFGIAVILIAVFTFQAAGGGPATSADTSFSVIGFLGMTSIAATWQIAYAPYVSDYSRYLPAATPSREAFWYTYLGAVVGAIPVMTLGALLVTAAGGDGSVAQLLDIMPGPIGVFVLVMLFLGAIDAAVINLYGPSLCTLTLMQTFRTGWKPGAFARNLVATCTAVIAFMVALLFADNFLVNYSNFIHFLMCLLIPWSIVNLVDYYMIAKGQYDIAAFSDVNAGYGAFNIPALATYILGFVIQMPFMSGDFFTGPVAAAMNGVDVSWLVGSVASFFLYLALVRLSAKRTPALAAAAA